jgi:hypothetical protein
MCATCLGQFPTGAPFTAISNGFDGKGFWNGTHIPGEAIWPIA